jgi:hypothetical protein
MPETKPLLSNSPVAERARRYRARKRAGLRCLPIELRNAEIDALIAKGLLKPQQRDDDDEVREGLYAHLDASLGNQP